MQELIAASIRFLEEYEIKLRWRILIRRQLVLPVQASMRTINRACKHDVCILYDDMSFFPSVQLFLIKYVQKFYPE